MRRHLSAVVSRFRNHRARRFIGPLVPIDAPRDVSETGSEVPSPSAVPTAGWPREANGLRRAITGLLFWFSTTMKSSPSNVLRTGRTSSSRNSICSGLPCPTGRWRNHPNHRHCRLRRTTGRAGGLAGRGFEAVIGEAGGIAADTGVSLGGGAAADGRFGWVCMGAVGRPWGTVCSSSAADETVAFAPGGLVEGAFDLGAGPSNRGRPS